VNVNTPTVRIFEPASVFLLLLLNVKIAVVISCTNYTKVKELYFAHRGYKCVPHHTLNEQPWFL